MKIPLFQNKTPTLDELIARCKQEDRKAQKLLYERFSSKMLGLCRRYVGQLETAEELLSNGFIKAFRYINQFEHKGSFEGWLRKIMVRECLSHLRTDKISILPLESEYFKFEPVDLAADHLETADLMKMIDTLPSGYRTVFNLYVIEGYKHHEIAELLDISENTSKTQLMKAKLALQKMISAIEN